MSATTATAPTGRQRSRLPYAWRRLGISVLISTMAAWACGRLSVALPTVQADFGVLRVDVSLAYTSC